jgi:hypothetical protein
MKGVCVCFETTKIVLASETGKHNARSALQIVFDEWSLDIWMLLVDKPWRITVAPRRPTAWNDSTVATTKESGYIAT